MTVVAPHWSAPPSWLRSLLTPLLVLIMLEPEWLCRRWTAFHDGSSSA